MLVPKRSSFLSSLIIKTQRYFAIENTINKKWQNPNYTKVAIIGGGFSGITLAAYLPKLSKLPPHEIRLFDHNPYFNYTPNLDLVAFNIKSTENIEKLLVNCINPNVHIDMNEISSIDPDKNTFLTIDNKEYEYDYLFLSNGLHFDIDGVKGLKEALVDPSIPVISSYNQETAKKAYYQYQNFRDGEVIFYNPGHPKQFQSTINNCLLFEENLRKRGNNIRKLTKISYISSQLNIFPNIKNALQLNEIFDNKDIDSTFSQELIEIIPNKRIAIFRDTKTGKISNKEFALLYVSPNTIQSHVISSNPKLLNDKGILDIDPKHLVHKKYPNIFAIGHNLQYHYNNLPLSPASIISQSITAAYNLHATMTANASNIKPELTKWKGNSLIPIFVGNNRCLEIELDSGSIQQTSQPSLISYLSEIYISQYLFYSFLTKGRWFGEYGFRKPSPKQLNDPE